MPRYLLIESRDPFDSNDTRFCCDLAQQLASGVAAAPLDVVLDALAEGAKVIWH